MHTNEIDSKTAFPAIEVLPAAWSAICRELDRASAEGIERRGTPDETVFVPLCCLRHRPGRVRAPRIERTQLSDIEALIIAEVLLPPRDLVTSSATHVRFRHGGEGWDRTQSRFDDLVDQILERSPHLEVLARGHSHPFHVMSTRPSGIDREDHLQPCLTYNRALGIDAGFTFIAVRGEAAGSWALQAFATRDGYEVLDLGLAVILENENESVVGRDRCVEIPELGEDVLIDPLPMGWRRLRCRAKGAEQPNHSDCERVIALPPGFPDRPGRCFERENGAWRTRDVLAWEEQKPDAAGD